MYNAAHRHVVNTNAAVAVDTTVGGTELLPALSGKTSRKVCLITNCTSVVVYVAVGFNPTSTAFTYSMAAGTTVSLPAGVDGQIKALTASSSGNVRVYEGV